ncbi:unnamed protein product [Plutella xylostella]|uniref:(diamondback moth) hypothetical protein n=1 Tax=Plutella xylostella TaxID=51655 RepID=A0A8S4DW92_PLUXY|nr:unnamed protein product [Plutella xylostella]
MTMKLEVSDSVSNQSDYSCDSQSSQGSYNDSQPSSTTARPNTLMVTRKLMLTFTNITVRNKIVSTTLQRTAYNRDAQAGQKREEPADMVVLRLRLAARVRS